MEQRWNWNTPIVPGPSTKKTVAGKSIFNLYVGAQYLFKSIDEGRNWEKISPDLTTNNKSIQQQADMSGGITGDNTSAENHCTIFTITPHPKNEQIIWVGTDDGNLQVTMNGGKTWENRSAGIWKAGVPQNAWISCIELSAIDPNRMYITLDHHMYGDNNTYIVMSKDGGKTFSRLNSSEFTGFAHVVREDIVNEKLLFLGTEMGLFISLDGGVNWMRSKYQGMPWYNLVRDLKIQAQTNDLVIATHGRGVYILDNLQPLREMIKSDINKDAIFFPIQAFKYDFAPSSPGPPSNLIGWAAGNKVLAPTFYYYLKERSNDAVKIEIYDATNKKIKDFNGANLKGLNRVYWGLNINPPKVAKGGFIAQTSIQSSAFVTPKVPVGKYKVVLKVNGKTEEQWIEILPNPTKGYTTADISLLYNQGMRMFQLTEKLAVLVSDLDSSISVLEKNNSKDSIGNSKLEKLVNIRKEIIETNRKSVFFDEFKFRRRVADLYISVASSIEALSTSQEKGITVMEVEYLLLEKQVRALMK
jgi:hypothetical protein